MFALLICENIEFFNIKKTRSIDLFWIGGQNIENIVYVQDKHNLNYIRPLLLISNILHLIS